MLNDYIAAQRMNIDSARRFEPFALLAPQMDTLYTQAVDLVPATGPLVIAQLLLFCHKSYLSAVTLIGQAQVDDADAITRRVIEAARLADTLKVNPELLEDWTSWDERIRRWEQRQTGQKPKMPPRPKYVDKHPAVKDLMESYGILSDSGVHFTPELFVSLSLCLL